MAAIKYGNRMATCYECARIGITFIASADSKDWDDHCANDEDHLRSVEMIDEELSVEKEGE